jgi:hypothetical protein
MDAAIDEAPAPSKRFRQAMDRSALEPIRDFGSCVEL